MLAPLQAQVSSLLCEISPSHQRCPWYSWERLEKTYKHNAIDSLLTWGWTVSNPRKWLYGSDFFWCLERMANPQQKEYKPRNPQRLLCSCYSIPRRDPKEARLIFLFEWPGSEGHGNTPVTYGDKVTISHFWELKNIGTALPFCLHNYWNTKKHFCCC